MSSLTTPQQNVVLAAKDMLARMPYSKEGLINTLTKQAIHSAEDVTVAISSMDVNYQQQAIRSAKLRLAESPYTKKSLAGALIEYGRYTAEDTAVAVAKMDLKE